MDVQLQYDEGEAYLAATGKEGFDDLEIKVRGERGEVFYANRKVYCRSGIHNLQVVGQPVFEEVPIDMRRYQCNVFQNVADFLAGNDSLGCDGRVGLSTMEVLEKIREGCNEF